MSVFNGKRIKAEIYGASRGEKIGVKISGLDGFSFDEDKLKGFLRRRSPSADVYSTARKERDIPIFSGEITSEITTEIAGETMGEIAGGVTVRKIGGEFACEIINEDAAKITSEKASKKSEVAPEADKETAWTNFYGIPRPSHADYVRYALAGTLDFSGGGEFSGRLTAPFCVLGGICKQILEENFGIKTVAYLTCVGNVSGEDYYDVCEKVNMAHAFDYVNEKLQNSNFPSISCSEAMSEEIKEAKNDGDSVGATVECVTTGVKIGLGGALFGGLEGKIASVVYAIPAVKSVEFGYGERFAAARGSFANDALGFDENGNVIFESNRSGGINGGVSNGADIVFRASFRPTPTISKPQRTVDLVNKKNIESSFRGRNDVCVAVRAVPVVESAAAIALLDEILAENK
ncbi:MAG: chorismate synthase [Candidatus Borkfalkiaceae bacterium]|nr:chorismate synthase [Christensenellaceae bacterium]